MNPVAWFVLCLIAFGINLGSGATLISLQTGPEIALGVISLLASGLGLGMLFGFIKPSFKGK